MIPTSDRFDQSIIAALQQEDPLVADYRAFFALFDWSLVEQWQARRSGRGRPAHPESAYLKAFLMRLKEGFRYSTQLRDFLLKHPLLVIELGFRLVLDPAAPYGVDVEQTLPTRFWLGEKLRHLDENLLQDLLAATVQSLKQQIPGLGETVAFDVKHIYAWVKENNPRCSVKGSFTVSHIPKGDPDCRLGVKKRRNQQQPDGSSKEEAETLFGYGSGVAACTDPLYGDVVLAEYTFPFNEADVTYYRPLFQRAVFACQQYPTHVTADAAFDFWYVYQTVAHGKGIAAIALNSHGHPHVPRSPDGTPFCSRGLLMHPTFAFAHTNGYRAQRFRCPLLFPEKSGQGCEHEQFQKGKGCVKDVNIEKGGLMRAMLNREGALYKGIYKQRTAAERINSQAKELGIERPRVRNIRSVRNLNTLTHLFINVRALQKAKSINAEFQ
ncbi:MAG TPA: hypothetical protein VFQ30_21675 [Ktedonobacteraceae bacterium]|nr:hypothetical protein [Ktedonobacteraceae bacterium]